MPYEGAMDGKLFKACFKERLWPAFGRGRTLIMGNAAFHLKKHLERIAEAFWREGDISSAIFSGAEPDRAFGLS